MYSRESDVDRIRRNDESLTDVVICDSDNYETIEILAILDALKNNTVVKLIAFQPAQLNEEALVKLSEVMQCNTSVETLIVNVALDSEFASVNLSIVGLAPAPRRLKVIRFSGAALTSQQIGVLSEGAADCETLERITFAWSKSTDDFKAICQLCSRFPSLKRVLQGYGRQNLREAGRFTAVLEMLKTSKTIEEISTFRYRSAEERAAIKYHCRNNMIHNRIREKGLLAAKVPNSAWPLILKEFSDMPDVLYYLLQQNHSAMIGPTPQGCKRKQNFA